MVKSMHDVEITHTNGSVEAIEHNENTTNTQSYNSSAKVDVPAEEMDFSDYDDMSEYGSPITYNSPANENLAAPGTSPVEEIKTSSTEELTAEDIAAMEGSLSQEEYNQFVKGIENYYQEQADAVSDILYGEDSLEQKVKDTQQLYDEISDWVSVNCTGYETEEEYHKLQEQAVELVYKERIEALAGVSTFAEFAEFRVELNNTYDQLKATLKMVENLRDSAKYDYLLYSEDYINYQNHEITQADIDELSNYAKDSTLHWMEEAGKTQTTYDYKKYAEDHPGVTPADFVRIIEKAHPGSDYVLDGVSTKLEDLKALIEVEDLYPDMVKKYSYFYSQSPEQAEQYLKDTRYELNNIKGQLKAKAFLDTLAEAGDDEDAIDEAIYNEFGVHVKGVSDGLDTFFRGLGYSIESLFGEENRVMDAEEYEKMYILQALMSKKDKEKLGLINEDGTATDPNAIIDFSKEYTGAFLSNNYEISQGIGNMLPSVILSTINPTLGSVALGISAYGNAYHGAMVGGADKINSVLYGLVTGTSEAISERILGGLPGLSDTSVTGLKSLANAMRKEANQEMFQGVFDSIFRAALLGEKLPSDWEGLKEYALDIGKQGLYGAITAGYMQLPSLTIFRIKVNSFNTYMQENNISIEEYQKIIEELRNQHAELSTFTDDEIKVMLLSEIYSTAINNKIEKAQTTEERIEILNNVPKSQIIEVFKKLSDNPELCNELMANVESPFMLNLTEQLLEPTLNYYESAAKMVADNGETYKNFLTYRNHCEGHVQEVAVKTMEAVQAIQQALAANGMEGFSGDVNLYECYIAALWHDTGMAAGAAGIPGLDSYYDSDGNVATQDLIENKNGDLTRSNHSFNSAMTVLMNADQIAALGVDPNIIAMLCFSHSKSNSGIGVLSSSSDWSLCISKIENAVQYYNSQNPNNPITFPNGANSFVESLVISGILLNDECTDATTTVKGKEVNYKEYNINPEKLAQLASEAFALRLGDANTNNRNLGTNQAGDVIDIDSFIGDLNNSFAVEDATFDDINALVVAEALGISLEEAKSKMASKEISFFGTKTGLTIEIGGETLDLSPGQLAFILGENNINFSTNVNDKGLLVEQFDIIDPTQVPASTLYNIVERLGELDTAAKGNFIAGVEIRLNGEGLTQEQKNEIENYYKNFISESDAMSLYKDNSKIVWY